MSLSVQTSFSPKLINKHFTNMIECGNAAYNNFIYGVKQPINYFDFIKSKNCLKYNYTAEMLADVLKHLAGNNSKPAPTPQENVYINKTHIEEDMWDSIQW